MEKELTQGQLKDLILKFLIENSEQYFNPYKIKLELFPELNMDEVTFLIEKIINSVDKIVEGNIGEFDNSFVKANGLTERFIKQGGFEKIEKNLKEEADRVEKREMLEITLAESNIEANKRKIQSLGNIHKCIYWNSKYRIINLANF